VNRTRPVGSTTAGAVAVALLDLVEDQLGALASGPLPGLRLPRVLMANEVGPDVRADLLFTLGLLHECGRTDVAGGPVADHITRLLAGVHGRRTNTFYSYRVAETVGRFGSFEDNPLIEALTGPQREQVAIAADSTDWIELLDAGILPRNYAAVLARCEHARESLGLLDDPGRLESLVDRVRSLLGGHLDDSNTLVGRYDIYTVDIHLFCEPLAPRIGERWEAGTRKALDLVDRVATRDGAAVAWGRSTGALAACHTIELGGLVARHELGGLVAGQELGGLVARNELVDDPHRWLARSAHAASRVGEWFRNGWITAHQYRSSDPYRGLDRRLQMTLDCLGKLVEAARGLLAAGDTTVVVDEAVLFPQRDEMVWFDRERNAGVWSFRGEGTAFTLPLVGGTTTDYLPAPRNPGLHEVPVGSALVSGTPLVLRDEKRYAGGGLPASVDHRPGMLQARYEGFPLAGEFEPDETTPTLGGSRDVTWRVEGRSLVVEERLRFDQPPHGVALQVVEPHDRPLDVRFDCDAPHRTSVVDVGGIAEYRSCWGELPRLHQIDVDPSASVELRWSVTPVLRIASSAVGAAYNDSLYAALGERVRVRSLTYEAATDPGALAELATSIDQFHLHWPEWLLIGGVEAHQRLADGLRAAGVRIVWTQHNLTGHDKNPEVPGFYRVWADAADLVIHHSRWGRDRVLATYPYRSDARHVVIPHAHFGGASPVERDPAIRSELEGEFNLRPGVLRLGIVGAPRAEKDVELVMRAVARCNRSDIELLVLALRGDEEVPDDPRVVAHRYEMVPRTEYDRRLAALDALVMPFDPDGEMLTTGTVGDAVGHGIPTLASSWEFLAEALGDGAVVYGTTEDDLVDCLESLDRQELQRAAAAAAGRRSDHEWTRIAQLTLAELDRLGSQHD
jgi:hypothetical protein